jgi:hypothetical protein
VWYYDDCFIARPAPANTTKNNGKGIAARCLSKVKDFHKRLTL